MLCPAKKFQLCYSITKQNALLANCSSGWNTHVWTLNYCIFIQSVSFFVLYCILLKNDSLLRILRFPSYFETLLFRTFFPFPWDFEIAGFNCILIFKVLKGGCERCCKFWVKTSCKDFKKDNFLGLHSLQAQTCISLPLLKK